MKEGNPESEDRAGITILVVEDECTLREGLAMNLRLRGYNAITAADGEEGLCKALDLHPDLILLDIMLPKWSGLDLLEELRKRRNTAAVLILSARKKTADKVEGLRLGADDYLSKPFDLPELMARVDALLRRQSAEKTSPRLTAGDLVLDPAARTVHLQGKKIPLSAKEFDLLRLLASSPGRVFTREMILEEVWGWRYEGTTRTVDNFIAALRKKLGSGKNRPVWIRTIPRVGYSFRLFPARGRPS